MGGSQQRRELLDDDQVSDSAPRTPGDILASQAEQHGVPRFRLAGCKRFDGVRRRGEPLAHSGQLLQAHRVGEEAVVADADEAAGQEVEQKAAQKGGGVEGGEPGDVAVSAVLPTEGDKAVLQGDEPIVGEGDAIGIATEVGEDLLSAGEGGLAVHDPRLTSGLLELTTEVFVRSPAELLLVEGLLEQAEQLAAEDLREHAHGQEEVAAGGDPPGVVDVEPPAGDDAVDVRMVTPSVTIPTARR